MTRRLVVIALAALLAPLFVEDANAALPGTGTAVETIPPTPNLPVVYRGIIFRTNSQGVALLPPQLVGRPRVPPTTVSAGRRAIFQRWYGRSVRLRAALDIYYRVRLRYVDLHGRLIDPKRVSSIQIRSSIGERFHPTTRILWLRGTRVVPLNGGLESKPIYYTIERVVVGGSNVVNESQQKFFPARERGVTVQLLFYRARFRSRDAFFGFVVGDKIRLTFPQGTTRRSRQRRSHSSRSGCHSSGGRTASENCALRSAAWAACFRGTRLSRCRSQGSRVCGRRSPISSQPSGGLSPIASVGRAWRIRPHAPAAQAGLSSEGLWLLPRFVTASSSSRPLSSRAPAMRRRGVPR